MTLSELGQPMTRSALGQAMICSALGQAMTGSPPGALQAKIFFSPQVSDYSLL